MSSQDPDLEGANHNTMPGSGFQDRKSHRQLKPRSPLIYSSSYAGQKTSLDLYEESAQETTLCNSKRSRNRIRSKHDPEVMRSDPLSRHHSPYGGIVSGEQSRPLLHDVDKVCSKFVQKGEYFSRPSNLVLGFSKSPDIKERGISTGIEKVSVLAQPFSVYALLSYRNLKLFLAWLQMEKLYGGRKSIKECGDRNLLKMHPTNGMRVCLSCYSIFEKYVFIYIRHIYIIGTQDRYADMHIYHMLTHMRMHKQTCFDNKFCFVFSNTLTLQGCKTRRN